MSGDETENTELKYDYSFLSSQPKYRLIEFIESLKKKNDVQHSQIQSLIQKNESLSKEAEAGKNFQLLLKPIKENKIVKDAWDKFLISLRLTGYDK